MAPKHNRQRKLREAKKAAKRRQQSQRETAQGSLSISAARGLDEANELLAAGDYDEAIEVLEELRHRYPRRLEILSRLAEAQLEAGDLWSYQLSCERLTIADPDEPTSWLALGAAAMQNQQIAASQRAFAHIATTWPNHPDAAQAKQLCDSLHEFLATECRRRGLDEAIGFRVLLLHDEVNLHLHVDALQRVCEVATRLLAMCPTFAPALNNRAEAHFRSARFAEAIADSRRVLGFDSTNYHALANLTRYLYLAGQFEEAQEPAAALKACDATEPDAFQKKAETFAILGDWEAVRQAVDEGQSAWANRGGTPELAEHLAGVALANLGDLKGARQHWRCAAMGWSDENLEDSQRPPGQQHGPWAFPLEHWIPRGAIEGLTAAAADVAGPRGVTRIVERHFKLHPQLELLADVLLQRSDPSACELLIGLARLVKRPMIFAALKKFGLGQRGSDALRMKAMMALSQAGYVEGQVEMWSEGKLRLLQMTSQKIDYEPITELTPEVNRLMISASEALQEGRGDDAERLFDKVLQIRPGDVSVRYNRAVAIAMQGREAEALNIVRQLHQDQPDYIFARTHLAEHCIANGDLEQAKALLAPISQKSRLHVSEFTAWSSASISWALAMNQPEMARSLLAAWEQIVPDDHRIKIWKDRISGRRGLFDRFRHFFHQAPGDAHKP